MLVRNGFRHNGVVQTIGLDQLQRHLPAFDGVPRVVVGGNAATPWVVLDAIDRSIERYRIFALNSAKGISERPGVIAETPFVGPGMRHHPALVYVPSRLSMVPVLFERTLPPDVVVLHCAPPQDGLLSLGIEVNILPAAVDACRARGGLVIAVINSRMPYTSRDSPRSPSRRSTWGAGRWTSSSLARTAAVLMTPVALSQKVLPP